MAEPGVAQPPRKGDTSRIALEYLSARPNATVVRFASPLIQPLVEAKHQIEKAPLVNDRGAPIIRTVLLVLPELQSNQLVCNERRAQAEGVRNIADNALVLDGKPIFHTLLVEGTPPMDVQIKDGEKPHAVYHPSQLIEQAHVHYDSLSQPQPIEKEMGDYAQQLLKSLSEGMRFTDTELASLDGTQTLGKIVVNDTCIRQPLAFKAFADYIHEFQRGYDVQVAGWDPLSFYYGFVLPETIRASKDKLAPFITYRNPYSASHEALNGGMDEMMALKNPVTKLSINDLAQKARDAYLERGVAQVLEAARKIEYGDRPNLLVVTTNKQLEVKLKKLEEQADKDSPVVLSVVKAINI